MVFPQYLFADARPGGIRFHNLSVDLEHKSSGHEVIDGLNKRRYVRAVVPIHLVDRWLAPDAIDGVVPAGCRSNRSKPPVKAQAGLPGVSFKPMNRPIGTSICGSRIPQALPYSSRAIILVVPAINVTKGKSTGGVPSTVPRACFFEHNFFLDIRVEKLINYALHFRKGDAIHEICISRLTVM